MKKTHLIVFAVLIAILALSCASKKDVVVDAPERKSAGGLPQFVRDYIKKAGDDTLVGVGTAKMATLNQSRTLAQTRARAEISRQLETIIQDMVRDYTAGSEVDHSAVLQFNEQITVALSKATLVGASIVDEDMDQNENYWVVIMLNKANAANEINQAQAAAKLAVPAMASFSAEARMNEAFDRATREEIGYSDR